MCERCAAQGRTELGEELHHVVPLKVDPSLKCGPTNTVLLCRFCHGQVEAGADLLVNPKANGQRQWRP